MYTIPELKERNNRFAALLNCSSSESQLKCFRKVTPAQIQDAALVLSKEKGDDG